MGLRKLPYAFTQEGIAMLSGILNSDRAIAVNIQIMRTFTKLREFLSSHKELAAKLQELEQKFSEHDQKFAAVFEAIRKLIEAQTKPKRSTPKIGFKQT